MRQHLAFSPRLAESALASLLVAVAAAMSTVLLGSGATVLLDAGDAAAAGIAIARRR